MLFRSEPSWGVLGSLGPSWDLCKNWSKSARNRYKNNPKHYPKIVQKSSKNLLKISSKAVLGTSWGVLGPSWGVLGRPGTFWGDLRLSWTRLGGVLGPSWGVLKPSWARLGAVFGWSWGVLGRLGGVLGLIFVVKGIQMEAFYLGCNFLIDVCSICPPKIDSRTLKNRLNLLEK